MFELWCINQIFSRKEDKADSDDDMEGGGPMKHEDSKKCSGEHQDTPNNHFH